MYAQVVFDPKKVGVQQAEYFADEVKSGKLGTKPVKVARQFGNKGDVYTTEMLAGQNTIIDPLIASGDIKVVCEDYIKDWAPDNATKATEQCLTKTQNKVDAFFGFYDGITAGMIAALKAKNLETPVYGGQNPELTGLQYMLTGDQQDDVLKAFKVEADAAATLTHLEEGKDPGDAVQQAVDLGMFTWQQICTGPAAETATCKAKL